MFKAQNAEQLEAKRVREEKNKAAVKYYRANRDKILEKKHSSKTARRAEECKERGIPEYLGKYITFAADDTVLFRFENIVELRKTLYWLKFKSDYTEDIRFEKKAVESEIKSNGNVPLDN